MKYRNFGPLVFAGEFFSMDGLFKITSIRFKFRLLTRLQNINFYNLVRCELVGVIWIIVLAHKPSVHELTVKKLMDIFPQGFLVKIIYSVFTPHFPDKTGFTQSKKFHFSPIIDLQDYEVLKIKMHLAELRQANLISDFILKVSHQYHFLASLCLVVQ